MLFLKNKPLDFGLIKRFFVGTGDGGRTHFLRLCAF
nr:MAG TPA: hypothetical protein [Caudoviricetes sp.]